MKEIPQDIELVPAYRDRKLCWNPQVLLPHLRQAPDRPRKAAVTSILASDRRCSLCGASIFQASLNRKFQLAAGEVAGAAAAAVGVAVSSGSRSRSRCSKRPPVEAVAVAV